MLKAGYAKGLEPSLTAWCKEPRRYCLATNNWPEPFTHEQRLVRALYRAIILQAIQDLGSNSHKSEAKNAKRDAAAWIGTDDFKEICLRAGWTPEFILDKMNQVRVNGYSWRKPAGQGWRVKKRMEALKSLK